MEPGGPSSTLLTIIILSFILQSRPEVVSFGPLHFKEDEISDVTHNETTLKEILDILSQNISLEEPFAFSESAIQLPTSASDLASSESIRPLSSQALPQDGFLRASTRSAQPSQSLANSQVLYQSVTPTEEMDINNLNSIILESSESNQPTLSFRPLETSPSFSTQVFQDHDVTKPEENIFSSMLKMSWITETIPLPRTYTDVSITSLKEDSIILESSPPVELYTFSYIDTMTEDAAVVSSIPLILGNRESTMSIPSMVISEEVTSFSTKNLLQSIFSVSSLGVFTAQDSNASPSIAVLMTSSPDSSAAHELSPSVFPEISESLLMESKEITNMLPVSPVPTLMSQYEETVLPSYSVPSDFMYTQWWSEDYLKTATLNPSGLFMETVLTNVVSDTPFLVSTTEVLESVFPSVTVLPTSMDILESSMDFTSLVDSIFTEFPVPTVLPSETVDVETHLLSLVGSTMLMPSLSELFVSSMMTLDFESSLSTVAISESTPFLDSSRFVTMNTIAAPAFVPSESVMYFSQTISPPIESENVVDLASSHVGSSSLFSSFPEEISTSFLLISSDETFLVTQDLSSTLDILKTAFSTFMMEASVSSVSDTISVENTLWPTVSPSSVLSSTPFFNADWIERSSSILLQSPEMWEVTKTIVFESGIFYTSAFSGATSSLLPSFSEMDSTTPALSTLSFSSNHTSSALIEETLQTSLFILVAPTKELPAFMSDMHTSEVYISLVSTQFLISPTLSVSSDQILSSTLSQIPTLSLPSSINWETTTSSLNILSTVNPLFTTSLSLSTHVIHSLMSTPVVSQTSSISLSSSPTELIPIVATMFTPTISTSAAITHTEHDTTTPQVTTTTTTISRTTKASTTAVPVTSPSGLTAGSTPTVSSPFGLTPTSSPTTTRPTLLCDISNPEPYLVTVVLSRGSNLLNVTNSIKELLMFNFSRAVEIEVYTMSEKFSFMVTSGPFVYTAIAVANILMRSSLVAGPVAPILSLQTALLGLDQRFHVQTVLQFVPQSVDVRLCTFSEQIQKGLSLALYEVRRMRQESENVTVQIVNITTPVPQGLIWKAPVTVSYAVRDRSGFMNGSDVSDQLRNLSLVEFSFFLGFPVKQIAEPSQYPQLNISPHYKDTWLRTVLLGVQEQQLKGDTFQMEMERKLAQVISEATLQKRRWKRASLAGSNTVQVVNVSRLEGSDDPVQLIYFIEDQYGGRLTADKASSLMNEVDIQRAAIILGYRLQGVVAQPLSQAQETERQAQNLWIIVGVAVPVLVVTVIIVILYWKLCRTDKLDFQPDTMSNLQQRQKLQAPNVKGFDFAKQHLGQHNKDEVLVVHEPPPPVLHGPLKDSTPSENGDIPTPKSKTSTKPNKIGRHRGRITPSDAGSTASEPSSGKESADEGGPRPSAPPRETPQRLKAKGEMPVLGSGVEQHSSASIFEHVDRMSRSSEASRRLPSKIQLIAMQPMATPPMHGLSAAEREAEANKINREIQTTLRHKSEIEHHRNKIRLRAKRKGHYEFPLVDVVGFSDTKERQRMYRRAQMQFDKILDPAMGVPTVFIEPRKSSRARRSPKQRRRQQGSSSPPDADRDRLIATDSDGTYKRTPGVSNSAYVSDPDLPSDNPTPLSELGKYPGSPPRSAPPTQYVAPQPSIEEVRQTMQSLLDDAFALVAPSSQGPGAVQAGNSPSGQQPVDGTPAHTGWGTTSWGAPYPAHQSLHYNRFVEYGVTQPSAPSMMTRSPGFGSGFLPPSEITPTDPQQAEGQYPGRMYPEDIPSVARPRPLGSTSGPSQIHQLTQVGIASRMGVQSTDVALNRTGQPTGGPSWSSYYNRDEETPRNLPLRDTGLTHGPQDYGTPQLFGMSRTPGRQPTTHLPPSICYPVASAEDVHPGHSSASLIKAIREELLRLSQKQVVAPAYHS
ncbi:UPF0606 protein KIAA1549 homolog isoform X2 [Hyperolius riggenbachi]|uniref:UPF0606 protein KIAA1549 homolog isoform X2 n=1 Tax=Hyperolius riggenbachi TaxID=752182 RepID=UPI0035A35BD7